MKGKSLIIVIIAVLLVLGAGGYWAYTQGMLPIKPNVDNEFGGPLVDEQLNINSRNNNDTGIEQSEASSTQAPVLNDQNVETGDVPVADELTASPVQEDILSYTQFIGDGFTFSFPKSWYTEISEDKKVFVGKSGQYETNKASLSVQAGTSSKSLEDFTFAAVQLLWDKGNQVSVYDNKVGSFPAKELRYENKEEGTSSIQLITVDADVSTAYIMTLKCLTSEVARYATVYQDIMSSFKLIDLAEEPVVEVEDDVKGNDSLFD